MQDGNIEAHCVVSRDRVPVVGEYHQVDAAESLKHPTLIGFQSSYPYHPFTDMFDPNLLVITPTMAKTRRS